MKEFGIWGKVMIYIFVSSTFKDMHYERDLIHEKVLPQLNSMAAEYGDSVAFCAILIPAAIPSAYKNVSLP